MAFGKLILATGCKISILILSDRENRNLYRGDLMFQTPQLSVPLGGNSEALF